MLKYPVILFLLVLPFATMAQSTCKDTLQVDPYHACAPSTFQPVCGCDNVTYRNECAAQYWGGLINSGFNQNWTPGICPYESFVFDFVPNPIGAYSGGSSDSHLHIYFNENVLPASYSVYILDMFNKVKFQWVDIATYDLNNSTGSEDRGVPVRNLTADYFSQFQSGVYLLIITVNGEQKTKKIIIENPR
jgi:hypothetical protein